MPGDHFWTWESVISEHEISSNSDFPDTSLRLRNRSALWTKDALFSVHQRTRNKRFRGHENPRL